MSVCGGWSLVRHRHIGTEAITLWCRSWLCTDCAPRRHRALCRFAVDGKPTTFLTLTVNPAIGESPDQRARGLSEALAILIKRARRKFTKSGIEYLAVFEETKRGEPHLHILLRAPFIPQRWISAQMKELIAAPIVDIRRVGKARNAALYLAKYLSKGPKPFADLKRYWSSQGYAPKAAEDRKDKESGSSGWSIVQEPLWYLVELWQDYHSHPVWDGEHRIFWPARAGPS